MSSSRALAVTAVALLAWSGCSGPHRGGDSIGLASAVMLDGESASLGGDEIAQLEGAGIGMVVVKWARLNGRSLERLPTVTVPRGVPALLVIEGRWQDAESGRDDVAVELERLLAATAAEAEAAGVLVRGLLLAFDEPRREQDGRLIGDVMRLLERRRLLGVRLAPEWLDRREALAVADKADFVLCQIYGEEGAEESRDGRWDVDRATEAAALLESSAIPHLLGIATSGALRPSERGRESGSTGPVPRALLREAQVEGAFSFEGYHRQQLEVRFERSVRLPLGARLPAGRVYRLSRPTVEHLDLLLDRLGRSSRNHRLGLVFTGLRADDDARGVPLSDLLAVLEESYAPRAPTVTLTLADGRLTVTVVNVGPPTAVAARENNYVEVSLSAGSFGSVELGDFQRMELVTTDGRRARLYFGFLERHETIVGGPFEIRGSGVRVSGSASVLGPTGVVSTFDVEPGP